MASIHWVNPRYAELVRRHGLGLFDRVMRWTSGQPMVRHARRDVTRVRLDDGADGMEVYVKREWRTYWKDRLAGLVSGLGWGTKARREWRVLRKLAAAGVGCPDPVILAEQGFARPQGYLIVRALPGAVNLTHYLAERRGTMSVRRRRAFAAHLAGAIARLHNAGVDHPDLYSKHVFLSEPAGTPPSGPAAPGHGTGDAASAAVPVPGWDGAALPAVSFIDFQRSSAAQRVPLRKRLRDLAALHATIPAGLASTADRWAFLRAYLAASRVGCPAPRAAAAHIGQRTAALRGRRKIQEMLNDAVPPDPLIVMDGVHAAPRWADALRRAGLDGFAAIMNAGHARVLRRLADRDNSILELPTHAGPVRAYLKRHRAHYARQWLAELFFGRRSDLPGPHEAIQIARLEQAGVRTMELVACGQRWCGWGCGESFLLTREIDQARPLDDLLREEFAGPLDRPRHAVLRTLIREVAGVARRFHDAGYSHRDFYCCHFLVVQTDEPVGVGHNRACPYEIHLIDLQRVRYRRAFRQRWVVKDLAQLDYSAPASIVSRSDRLRFLCAYLGLRRLGRGERALVRRVRAKAGQIARHDARKKKATKRITTETSPQRHRDAETRRR